MRVYQIVAANSNFEFNQKDRIFWLLFSQSIRLLGRFRSGDYLLEVRIFKFEPIFPQVTFKLKSKFHGLVNKLLTLDTDAQLLAHLSGIRAESNHELSFS
jgi:hypothetical protein